MEAAMDTVKNALSNTWDSLLGRVAILAATLGWVPFALLGMAHRALLH
jgi:hypothetical protein